MAVTIKTLRAEFDATTTRFKSALRDVEGRFNQFRSRLKRTATAIKAALRPIAIGVGAITAAIGAVIIATTKMAAAFERDMARVHTLLVNLPVERIRELGEEIKTLAMESGQSLGELAGALYQITSAGVDAGKGIDVLRIAVKGAVAGGSTATEMFELLSAVIKGYGLTWKDAGDISDWAFKVVEQGQTTIAELTQSIGRVAPIASQLGMSLEELGGAYATLTGVTGNTMEVTTQLRGVLASILKPAESVAHKWNIAEFRAKGLTGMLRDLVEETEGNATAMAEYIPQIEALPGALALAGPQAAAFAEKVRLVGDRADATTKAHAVMAKTLSFKWGQLVQTAKVVGIDIGQAFVEPIGKVVGQLKDWIVENRKLLRTEVTRYVNEFKTALEGLGTWWKTNGEDVLNGIAAGFRGIGHAIGFAADTLALLKGDMERFAPGLKEGREREAGLRAGMDPALAGLMQQRTAVAERTRAVRQDLGLIPRDVNVPRPRLSADDKEELRKTLVSLVSEAVNLGIAIASRQQELLAAKQPFGTVPAAPPPGPATQPAVAPIQMGDIMIRPLLDAAIGALGPAFVEAFSLPANLSTQIIDSTSEDRELMYNTMTDIFTRFGNDIDEAAEKMLEAGEDQLEAARPRRRGTFRGGFPAAGVAVWAHGLQQARRATRRRLGSSMLPNFGPTYS